MSEKVLVTGGAGYIGSHVALSLHARGHRVVLLDDFRNSSKRVPAALQRIAGVSFACAEIDLLERERVTALLRDEHVDSVVHCAGYKAVGESCADPLMYFENNVAGTIVLLQAMRATQVKRLVFSSSATVYGLPEHNPVTESAPLQVTNPYGRSKLIVEQMLGDVLTSFPEFRAAILRYFNPVGAHPSGEIGEDPRGVPNNLMPYLAQVAVGRRSSVAVFGNDYPTRDGTGIRDYLHVVDLAEAHVDAIDYLKREERGFTVNLGTGRGYSVLEVIAAFQSACGREIPYTIAPRRAGDVAKIYADPTLAQTLLGWRTQHDLAAMCRDAWRWQSNHPNGFADAGD